MSAGIKSASFREDRGGSKNASLLEYACRPASGALRALKEGLSTHVGQAYRWRQASMLKSGEHYRTMFLTQTRIPRDDDVVVFQQVKLGTGRRRLPGPGVATFSTVVRKRRRTRASAGGVIFYPPTRLLSATLVRSAATIRLGINGFAVSLEKRQTTGELPHIESQRPGGRHWLLLVVTVVWPWLIG